MSRRDDWKNDAACESWDVNIFFDKYEEELELRPAVDEYCLDCPVARMCFASGVTNKSYGVWGGVYLEKGKISKEFNNHKTKQDWAKVWETLTNDKD
jgi:hypothetical protein